MICCSSSYLLNLKNKMGIQDHAGVTRLTDGWVPAISFVLRGLAFSTHPCLTQSLSIFAACQQEQVWNPAMTRSDNSCELNCWLAVYGQARHRQTAPNTENMAGWTFCWFPPVVRGHRPLPPVSPDSEDPLSKN